MSRLSVLLPTANVAMPDILSFAELCEDGAGRLWQGQSVAVDPFQSFAAAAGAGMSVPVGIGVTLLPLRHPFDAALAARSLTRSTGQTAIVGFGPGGRSLQRSLLGAPYAKPLRATREYVSTVAALLAGRETDIDGDYFTCRGNLPSAPGDQQTAVGVGVLRAGMARIAGKCADAAITWMTPPGYIRDELRPALKEGARKAGRPPPQVIANVPLALHGPDFALDQLVLAGNAAHLRREHYLAMLAKAGASVDRHNARATAHEVVRVDGFLHGGIDRIVEGLSEYAAAGADEIVLNISGAARLRGMDVARDQLREILAAANTHTNFPCDTPCRAAGSTTDSTAQVPNQGS